MKTTIKLSAGRSLVVEPGTSGVRVSIKVGGIVLGSDEITSDEAGALAFGLEQAGAVRAQGAEPVRTGAAHA